MVESEYIFNSGGCSIGLSLVDNGIEDWAFVRIEGGRIARGGGGGMITGVLIVESEVKHCCRAEFV